MMNIQVDRNKEQKRDSPSLRQPEKEEKRSDVSQHEKDIKHAGRKSDDDRKQKQSK